MPGERGSRARVVPVGDLSHEKGPITVDLPVPHVALAIGAHPDDVEFGCGATLARWAASGSEIHHLVLTEGSRGTWDPGCDIDELVALRRKEQVAAARMLGGGDVTFLDNVDGELDSGAVNRRAVCEVIRRVRPDVVLGHDPWRRYRLHPDHRHAGWLTTDGLVAAREHGFFPETGPPHRPDHLLLWESDWPNHVEGSGGFADQKIAALMEHRSQHASTMDIRAVDEDETAARRSAFAGRVIDQLASHGAVAGVPSGEAFHRIDET